MIRLIPIGTDNLMHRPVRSAIEMLFGAHFSPSLVALRCRNGGPATRLAALSQETLVHLGKTRAEDLQENTL